MKKLFCFLLFGMVILTGTVACSKEAVNEEEVMELVKEYKTKQYTIKDPDKAPTGPEIGEEVKSCFSKDEFDRQMANRSFSLAPDIAKKTNKSIALTDIKLKKEKENDDGTVNYTYTLELKFYDDQTSEVIEKNGQLSISNDDGLKIARDWEDRTTQVEGEIF
ncbi:hypothetical protein ACH0BF_17165 [Pseudobacillus sp. 179-B 2D1 NHS]|uniref:hypothetical protein n=1 Tax=Pseudobacillus sp. 179-B 2D1 NHS TaxID=3374292 RepID=UPI003879ADF9